MHMTFCDVTILNLLTSAYFEAQYSTVKMSEKTAAVNGSKDVEMKDVEEKKVEEPDPKQVQKDKDLLMFEGRGEIVVYSIWCAPSRFSYYTDIREQMKLIEKGVNQKEPRYIHRAVRSLQSLRKKVTDPIMRRVVSIYFPPSKE